MKLCGALNYPQTFLLKPGNFGLSVISLCMRRLSSSLSPFLKMVGEIAKICGSMRTHRELRVLFKIGMQPSESRP